MNENIEQTRFSEEEPLFEKREGSAVEQPTTTVAPKVPMTSQKKRIVLIACVVGALLVLLILALMMRKPSATKVEQLQPEPTPKVVNQSEMQGRITTLRGDLKEADPTKQDLTFPPVNLELRLDKKVR